MVMIHPMVILIQVPAALPLVIDGKESLDMVRKESKHCDWYHELEFPF